MHRSIDEHFAEYRRNGYTIFKGFMPPDRLRYIRETVDAEFRQRHDEQPERIRASITDVLSCEDLHAFFKEHLLNPVLLDYAEHVMGPFVQGDGFYVVGTPPAQLTGWATGGASRQELLAPVP